MMKPDKGGGLYASMGMDCSIGRSCRHCGTTEDQNYEEDVKQAE
jgi:hypothetical protein